jgi:hypothetical protein
MASSTHPNGALRILSVQIELPKAAKVTWSLGVGQLSSSPSFSTSDDQVKNRTQRWDNLGIVLYVSTSFNTQGP